MDNGSATGGALPHAGHHGPIAPDSIMAHRMRQAINDRVIKRKGYTDAAHPGVDQPDRTPQCGGLAVPVIRHGRDTGWPRMVVVRSGSGTKDRLP
ncbi:hypothetical protein [Komagataeibacter oboediens]|uniref:hypothetical protein n=1 Tax=Komagataeibacter oboediens TaxID=65958 RepID=UPI001905E9D3|nr:hypothetical protein [Komagataeibacter oboediens]